MLILSEIGDINRFSSPEKLVSYAVLCPSTYQSGDILRHGKIAKQGSKWLRWILIKATLHYVRPSAGRPGDFYRRLARKKVAKIARVAHAREILHSSTEVCT